MTKPVSRDAKLKWPKESTGRAFVNCSSGKYRSSPIKPMSLDMSLEHWSQAKVRPLQVLRCSFAASHVHSLRRVRTTSSSCAAHGKVGSEIALRQVLARPNFAAGSYLHANLAWHLGKVYRVPAMCVFEAWSLIAFHPLGTNHQES